MLIKPNYILRCREANYLWVILNAKFLNELYQQLGCNIEFQYFQRLQGVDRQFCQRN